MGSTVPEVGLISTQIGDPKNLLHNDYFVHEEATRPTGTYYYQPDAAGPIFNGEIEGGVYTSIDDTDDYDDEGWNDDPSDHQQRGRPNHEARGQYFNTTMSADPGDYSGDPTSEGTPSHYPESYNLSSNTGPTAFQRRPPPPSRRAGRAHNYHVASQGLPPKVDARPPSRPASSHGSGLPPIHEGPPPTSFANAYPSPASSQDGQPFEESYANSEVNGCLAPDSVSNGIQKLSLDDKADCDWPKYSQFPPTPPESPHQMPPRRTWSAKNPFVAIVLAERRAAQSRRTGFN
ncbi:hypothetical protein EST38_g6856 [Candolleomyces aberdarensis]|uniref:Uncharacterized protein n=1 Tax=Candolleomyces aberdarensis TaxID=2316362 RepID=A0A4Q2DIP0_9AGAR|nr:hypothetical protein EST38_g6856 [Candolleomyces aberdarensis]